MQVSIIEGDLLQQPVEVIVNAWNKNIIPWWPFQLLVQDQEALVHKVL